MKTSALPVEKVIGFSLLMLLFLLALGEPVLLGTNGNQQNLKQVLEAPKCATLVRYRSVRTRHVSQNLRGSAHITLSRCTVCTKFINHWRANGRNCSVV